MTARARHRLGRVACALLGAGCAPPAGTVVVAPDLTRIAIQGPAVTFTGSTVPPCYAALHDGGADVRLTWDWGDGAGGELPSPACHTWTTPGEYAVFVQAEAGARRATAVMTVRAVPQPLVPPPTASSTIVLDPQRNQVFVVNPDADTVAVLRLDPLDRVAEIPVCDRPRTLALAGDVLAVACQGGDALELIDAKARSSLRRVALGRGSAPYGVAADPAGDRFFVTLQGSGEVAAVRGDGSIEGRTAVGPDVRAIAARGDLLLVTRWRADADGARVYAVSPAPLRRIGEAVLARDEGHDNDGDNSGVPGFLDSIAFAPDGSRAIVSAVKANVTTGVFRTGTRLNPETTARGVHVELRVGKGGAIAESRRRPLDDLDMASAVTFSPDGARLFATVLGAQLVVVLDAFTLDMIGSVDDVGVAPRGVAITADGTRLLVHAELSRAVRAYDVSREGGDPPLAGAASTVEREPLAPDVLRGARVFATSRDPRMSKTRYLSCASCHLDGEGDGLVWDFTQRGEGLRNTIPLAGGAGVAPLHFSANFDEVQDFEHDIRAGQGGTGFLSEEVFRSGGRDQPLGAPKAGLSPELDALAAYLGSLRSFGTSPHGGGDSAPARARGQTVFTGAGCPTCHPAPRYTDSAWQTPGIPLLHDVGTLGPGSGKRLGDLLEGLDTPTLRGLFKSAPYLHDGSARTVGEAVMRHRDVKLAPADLADLEAFLLALDDA